MKLLIVDDEAKTRHGLTTMIQWNKIGIDQVLVAANGEDAIRISLEYTPDIIISDIRMPEMDGIELCTYLRSLFPTLQIIIVSGYAEKSYLKAAINLEVVSYVEKPIRLKEIEEAAQKAAKKHLALQQQAHERTISETKLPLLQQLVILNLISGSGTERVLHEEMRAAQLILGDREYFRVLIIRTKLEISNPTRFDERLRTYLHSMLLNTSYALAHKDSKHIILLLHSVAEIEMSDSSHFWEDFTLEISRWSREEKGVFCAVGPQVQVMKDIPTSYHGAVIALQRLFFEGYGCLVYHRHEESQSIQFPSKVQEDFAESLKCMDIERALELLKDIYRQLRVLTGLPSAIIKDAYLKYGYQLLTLQNRRHQTDILQASLWERFQGYDTFADIHNYIVEITEDALRENERNSTVNQAIGIIFERYSEEDLSIKTLAQATYVTPHHLSKLFRRETSKTILQFITDVRMEKAKELLLDKKLKLYHIAVLVGYSDASYFTKLFKRTVGMMPSEYRERYVS